MSHSITHLLYEAGHLMHQRLVARGGLLQDMDAVV